MYLITYPKNVSHEFHYHRKLSVTSAEEVANMTIDQSVVPNDVLDVDFRP